MARKFAAPFVVVAALALPIVASAQDGHLTRNGFRTPVFGVSQAKDANGKTVTTCAAVPGSQVEVLRFGRRVSRVMEASSPQAQVSTEGGATFVVTYTDAAGTGFQHPGEGGNRRAALEGALRSWSKVLRADQPIRVTASMYAIDDGDDNPDTAILALASPTELWVLDNVGVPSALAWQMLGGVYENATDSDITVEVNDAVDWDYSLSGVGAGDRSSFIYTLMHEIAHGLGFIPSFDPETGKLLNDPLPFVYDKFVNRGSSRPNRVMDHAAEEQKRDYKSNDLFFNGEHANAASQQSVRPLPMIKLYAPDPFEPGSSIGHVDQNLYEDIRTGLMTPYVGEGTDKIDPLTLAIMKDLGYTLVDNPVTSVTPTRVKQ